MRKLFLFFIACAFAQAQPTSKPAKPATLNWCRLGVDPLDATRQPDWGSECVIKVPATPVVMTTGSGRQVRCILPPLTPVVVDRVTGAVRWVLACGNPIVSPANWVPQGTRICGPEQPAQPAAAAPAPVPAAAAPAPVPAATPTAPTEVRVEGEVRVVHSGEVRHVHENLPPAPEPAPAPTPQPKKGWWSRNAKWIVPVAIGAGAGAAVALTRGGGKNVQNVIIYQPIPPPIKR